MQCLPLARRRDTTHERSLQDAGSEHGRATPEPRAGERNKPAFDLAEGPENERVAGGDPEREGSKATCGRGCEPNQPIDDPGAG